MTKEELIAEIKNAFKYVKLEDGVGLWEGQGIDEYSDEKTIIELRNKDERNNWDQIPNKDLRYCQSSLSFFDAKGMRFCLPKFLIYDLLEEEGYAIDVTFTLGDKLNEEHQEKRFSLFDNKQIQCIIDYLQYQLPKNYTDPELNRIIYEWKQKLKQKDSL